MDPQFEKTPGLALPSPAQEQGLHGLQPQAGATSHETLFPRVEGAPASGGTVPMMPPQISTVPTQPATAPVQQAVPTVAIPATPSDDNTDALDEEWINKAKAIVEQTKHDPHMESMELSKVKAEYLRIRYNKHIKVAEEHSK